MGQKLRGFVGQKMSGTKPNPKLQEPFSFPSATTNYAFTPPKAGYWKFVGWGPGAQGLGVPNGSGASGAYVEVTKFLTPAQTVAISVAQQADTVFTFPDGSTATAAKAAGMTGGLASGGDINLSGTAGSATGSLAGGSGLGTGGGLGGAAGGGASGGPGAPANLPYRGGVGGTASATGPGVGGGLAENSTGFGTGLALAVFIRA